MPFTKRAINLGWAGPRDIVRAAASTTLRPDQFVCLATRQAADITITLPAAEECPGVLFYVKALAGGAGNVIVTSPETTALFSLTMTSDNQECTVWSNGTYFVNAFPTSVARSLLVQEDLAEYVIPLEEFRTSGTLALLGASAGTPAGAFGLTPGTHGTASPIVKGEAASGNTKTDSMRKNITLPPEYVAGQTVQLVAICAETVGAATVSTTIDCEAFKHDEDGTLTADLCATAAIDVDGATAAAKTFTITATALAPGDVLDVEFTGVTTDTGGTVGTILEIYEVKLLLDIKG